MERVVKKDNSSVFQNAQDGKLEGTKRSNGDVTSVLGRRRVIVSLRGFYQKVPHAPRGANLISCGIDLEPEDEYKDQNDGCVDLSDVSGIKSHNREYFLT